jgi:hypothetical protein
MKYAKKKIAEVRRRLGAHFDKLVPQGQHRALRIALYAMVFALPGGALGVLAMSWLDHHLHPGQSGDVKSCNVAGPPA